MVPSKTFRVDGCTSTHESDIRRETGLPSPELPPESTNMVDETHLDGKRRFVGSWKSSAPTRDNCVGVINFRTRHIMSFYFQLDEHTIKVDVPRVCQSKSEA